MPDISINDAFRQHGMRARFQGQPAMVLPITDALAEAVDFSQIRQGAGAGQMLVSWQEDGKRNGTVLNVDAKNDIAIVIPRADANADALEVPAANMGKAVLELHERRREAAAAAQRIARENEEAAANHAREVERGNAYPEDAPEAVQPEFAADAFEKVGGLTQCVKEVEARLSTNMFVARERQAEALSFLAKIGRAEAEAGVSAEDKAKIDEARSLRAEIGAVSPMHPDAAGAARPQPYQGNGEAARALADTLPRDPDGITSAQASEMMAGGINMDLVNRLFSVATSTPPMDLVKIPLSHAGMQAIGQELQKHVDAEATDAIVPRMQRVTTDAMSEYRWEGRVFSKDGADVLLMRDQFAAFAYVWDSESRVQDIAVESALTSRYTAADIPTDEELERLRTTLNDLRFDNGNVIDFDWDDEPEEDAEPAF